jgi:hypothetical protein
MYMHMRRIYPLSFMYLNIKFIWRFNIFLNIISGCINMDTEQSFKSETANDEQNNEFINKSFVNLCKDYKYIPSIMPATRRIIVIGDIHGDYDLAIKLLEIGKVIKKSTDDTIIWSGVDTYVVQVGDQIDRCRPKSVDGLLCSHPNATINDEASDIKILKLFNDLNQQADKYGGKVISLLGNHELMNVMGNMNYVSYKGLLEFNGKEGRIEAFKPGNTIAKMLGCSRLCAVIIGSNLFVHAGMLNVLLEKLNIKQASDLESLNILTKKWLLGLINKEYVSHIVTNQSLSMFWTRILGSIPPNMSNENPMCVNHIDKVLKLFNIGSIIIGHTPQSFTYEYGINSTCSNSIWRVDNASSSAFHGYDETYKKTGQINIYRKPQVLEIIDDKIFNILS